MNIWEHNDLSNIQVEDFEDSKIYWMDDFYKYPDLVYEEITREDPPLWKYGEDGWQLAKDCSRRGGVPGCPPEAPGFFTGQIRATASVPSHECS